VSDGPRIVVALDFAGASEALALVARLDPTRCRLKVGKELFTAAGPRLVEELVARGFGVFLDLKYHDIPSTVAAACRAAAATGAWMINVHAAGGRAMLEAARAAIGELEPRPLLVAVTVLTSLAQAELAEVGVRDPLETQVLRLARLARRCGLDGVVCSGRDLGALAALGAPGFLRVTPGVRPAGAASDDQKRVLTPGEALRAGTDYLVIGRPVTRAPDPLAALAAIEAEVAAALTAP